MMEQLHHSVFPIVVESTIESALLWLLVLAFLRWSRVADPALRSVLFSLPLFLSVALTTASHVLLPVRPSAVPHIKPLEALIYVSPSSPSLLLVLLLVAGAVGVAASLALVWRQWTIWSEGRSSWQRQQRDGSPLADRCNAMLQDLACRFAIPAPRLVLVASERAGSLRLGGSGYVFVPSSLAVRLDNEELEALLAHEMAHIARNDSLRDCLARVCRNLMLFNPLSHLALSRLEKEVEQAADDLAVRMGGNRLALASCLLKGYRFGGCRGGVSGPGLLGDSDILERRVRRMIDIPLVKPSKGEGLVLWLVAGGAAIAFALLV